MKNKKGFTLIELLAVIAILAILVVIAVPSVLKLFNKGKESAFDTQAKNVFKIAQTQFVSDQLGTG
ncbi:MAG: type II secretion system protein, partial [Bacilli bacterium]